MTLPEVLVTMAIAMIISLATFALVEIVMKRSGEIAARVETTASAAAPRWTRSRASCARRCASRRSDPRATARSIDAASPTSVTFYADFTDERRSATAPLPGAGPAHGHAGAAQRSSPRSSTKGTRDEHRQRVSYSEHADGRAPVPDERRAGVYAQRGKRHVQADRLPLLRVPGRPTTRRPAPPAARRTSSIGASADRTLTDAQLADGGDGSRIDFKVRAEERATTTAATTLQNEVYVRTADPNAQTPKPDMPDLLKRLDARAERGFSMFLVIMAMFVTVDVRGRRVRGRQRRPAGVRRREGAQVRLRRRRGRARLLPQPAAAGPGLLDQVRHGRRLRTPSEPNPVNQQSERRHRPARWRNDPGRARPSTRSSCCRPRTTSAGDSATRRPSSRDVRRQRHGHVQDPRHRAAPARPPTRTRSIVATFRRDSFLNFVYFTDYENRDPAAETERRPSARRSSRTAPTGTARRAHGNGCVEIQFATGDAINGPLHTNDESLLICGTPTLRARRRPGRQRTATDRHDRGPRRRARATCQRRATAASTPTINTPTQQVHDRTRSMLDMPRVQRSSSRTSRRRAAASTPARRSSASTATRWTITNNGVDRRPPTSRGRPTACSTSENNGACNGEIPTDADYQRARDAAATSTSAARTPSR